ncbi:MAG: hypothetical protein NT163_13165 [Chlorobiales bacterium]|nr:hypothetical protein [Chlorobiales bacterium]
MATSDIIKESVFDPRIVQTRPKYAVEKGALSVTNVSVTAQTTSNSSVQWNVQVPSENVFVDRAVDLVAQQWGWVSVTVTSPAGVTIPSGVSLAGLIAPAAFPIQQSVTQASATINDATVTVNTQDVIPQILRLSDMAEARMQRTCPTMLDRYAKYPDTNAVSNSPLGLYGKGFSPDQIPNGAFNGFQFTDAAGVVPTAATTVVGGYTIVNGVPTLTASVAPSGSLTFPIYFTWTSTEKLLLPPFIFTGQEELSTGLFGVQNFQVQLNIAPASQARSIRVSSGLSLQGTTAGEFGKITLETGTGFNWGYSGSTSVFNSTQPRLLVQFLTPSLDIPLPPKNIVPYMEFPRYITSGQTINTSAKIVFGVNVTGSSSLSSVTTTLPNIPDLMMIYVKPNSYPDPTNADWTLPITNISLNFDNFSGLLANHTPFQLYKMSVDNGLDMDWNLWSGQVNAELSGAADTGLAGTLGGVVGSAGGALVLRPGRDFALQAGQAPGLVGNFTVQFSLNVQNNTGYTGGVNIYLLPISSGFFETIKGSSRIIKGVLTEQDILSAPVSLPAESLDRVVGGRMGGPAMGRPEGPPSMGRPARGKKAMNSYM